MAQHRVESARDPDHPSLNITVNGNTLTQAERQELSGEHPFYLLDKPSRREFLTEATPPTSGVYYNPFGNLDLYSFYEPVTGSIPTTG